jgi:hypothetical protein
MASKIIALFRLLCKRALTLGGKLTNSNNLSPSECATFKISVFAAHGTDYSPQADYCGKRIIYYINVNKAALSVENITSTLIH